MICSRALDRNETAPVTMKFLAGLAETGPFGMNMKFIGKYGKGGLK